MRTYKVTLSSREFNDSNKVNHYTQYSKYVSEDIFNKIYELMN